MPPNCNSVGGWQATWDTVPSLKWFFFDVFPYKKMRLSSIQKKIYFVFYLNKIWGRLLFNKTNNVVFNLNFFLVIFDLDKKLWSSYTHIKIFVRFTFTKKCKIPFRTPERPTSVHEHHIFVWDKGKSCNLDTLCFKYVYSSVNIL